ncbi:helix-turn-helix domain-containing protein [Glycomyces sp. NPDC047369]
MGVADLANLRFALSPLWEVTASIRVLKAPAEHRLHRRWAAAAAARLRGLDLRLLFDLVPVPTDGLPAFLAPPPAMSTPDLATELAAMRRLEPERFASGLAMVPATPAVAAFGKDLEAGAERLAAQVERYWEAALAPWWPRIRTLCERDLLHRSRLLAEGGARRLFADLAPPVSWGADGVLRIESPFAVSQDLDGRGLLLVPTVFGGERIFSLAAAPWQPTMRYPPRGLGLLWEAAAPRGPDALAGVLGPTRAALLAALAEPASTTDLADRCGLSAGGVSQQLGLLHAAGLVTRHRVGRRVLYARTLAAESLLNAA